MIALLIVMAKPVLKKSVAGRVTETEFPAANIGTPSAKIVKPNQAEFLRPNL